MSIKVYRYGNTIRVTNPVTKQKETLVNVIFTEEGRTGGDAHMSETSKFLSALVGAEVGLQNLRVHTQPILESEIAKFPLNREFPGHINRGLFSTPQLRQQVDVKPRMIDGRPTYFKTWIDANAQDDVDMRVSADTLMMADADNVLNSQIGSAEVEILKKAPAVGEVQLTESPE